MDLYSSLVSVYTHEPERPVLECDDGRAWTYSALKSLGDAMLTRMEAYQLRPGDRIIVQVYKSAEVIALYLACLRSRIVFVPLNTAYTSAEVVGFIEDADPSLVVIDPGTKLPETVNVPELTLDAQGRGTLLDGTPESPASGQDDRTRNGMPVAAAPSPTSGDGSDPAVMIYTSGTTGRSKGAVLSGANLLANAQALASCWGFTSRDVLLHALPVFHVHGLCIALHTAMLSGARIRFCSAFNPLQVCRELPECTVFMAVPTYYTRLLSQPGFTRERCADTRVFVSGSAPLLAETFDRFEQVTGHRILERYGMSETNVIASNPLSGERIAGTVGYAVDGTSVRIANEHDEPVNPGEVGAVQVSGPGVFRGYWRRPDLMTSEFTGDGYFRTGDLGTLDSDGRLTLIGRAKDLIISGGLNVYPAEIERLIDATPGILESAVVAAPDADFGERVEAFVVADGTSDQPLDQLIGRLHQQMRINLANFKRPKAFHLIESLPRNTMGKVQKSALRERLASGRGNS